jgi:hypothetical protein
MAYAPDTAEKAGSLAQIQTSCLPEMVWTYEPTSSAFTSSKLMYRCFRAWNLANKQGFKLHDVLYSGERLTGREIECFNLWIQSGGAMAAANMDHWDAVRLFDKVRRG